MPCRKRVWKLITLWVTCKGDLQLATCHSSSWTSFTRSFWYSFVHGRLVDNIQFVVEETCAVDLQFGHDILLSFGICSLYDTFECQWSMLTWNVVYWSVLHLISDSARIRYTRRQAWAEDIYIGSTLRFIVCLRHWAVWSLQVMGTYSWKLLEKSLD